MVVILILSPNGSCIINNDVTPVVHGTSTRVSVISSCSSQVDPDSTYATTKEGKYKTVFLLTCCQTCAWRGVVFPFSWVTF